MKIAGYMFMFAGGANAVCNFIFLFMVDSFTTFGWLDEQGQYQTYTLKPEGLYAAALFKIVGGILLYMQGKGSLNIYKPLLKEYSEAEAGITQGIVMNERKSKKKVQHLVQVKKITIAMLAMMAFGMMYFYGYAQDIANDFIDMHYAAQQN